METLQEVARAARRLLDGAELGARFVKVEARLPAMLSAHALAALSATLPDEPMIFWAPPGGAVTLGLGAALRITGRGETRFATLRDAAEGLPAWAELYAGFAFAPGGGGRFGDALAILPRFLLRTEADTTTLRVTLDRAANVSIDAQLALIVDAIQRGTDMAPAAAHETVAENDDEATGFVALVDEARTAIAHGMFDKVVLHRQTRLPRSGRSPAQTLSALMTTQPDSTTYSFRSDGVTFLGATPERLVRRQGKTLRADVLAGSWPRDGADREPAALLESEKDRGEHELTRAAIADVLRPLCARYDEVGPRVRTLPHLHHLHTAIEGVLATPRHVLDLVGLLHPTPAVGGSPRREALQFLARAEHLERGWYAAPIGWFRPDGDGDFAVALRCALVSPEIVTLYAGAGIVAASDPMRELAETSTKRRAIAGALGVDIR